MAAIRHTMKCPKCGHSFVDQDLEMVTGGEGAYFLKMQCESCGVNIVASVMNVDANNIVPDLDEIDLFFDNKQEKPNQKIKSNNPISFDDILEVHELLKNDDRLF